MKSAFNKELTDYQKSAKDKKHMALGILHNIMSGIDKLREYISNPSNPRKEIVSGLLQSNQFLYAHVFELCTAPLNSGHSLNQDCGIISTT